VENPVTVDALELDVRLMRAPTAAETALAGVLIDDAWEEIRGRVPALDARFDAGLVTNGQVLKVIAGMVMRVLRNPEAIRQWSVDDASFTRDTALSSGLLYVTADDIALLSGVPADDKGHMSFSAPMPTAWRP
jgi:hypothetical protein